MASVKRSFFGVLFDLDPGESVECAWTHPQFHYGDPVAVAAHPIRSVLAIKNLRVSRDGDERMVEFEVSNVGDDPEVGFGLGFGWVAD